MRSFVLSALFVTLAFVGRLPAQQPSDSAVTTCTFADGKELSLRYSPGSPRDQMPANKPWGPGGSPMYLFAQTAVTIGKANLPPDAYSLYVIGDKVPRILVVNRSVKIGSPYDPSQDIVRVPMESGELSSKVKALTPYFVHPTARQCNLRLYYGSNGAWAEFKEK